MLHRAYAWVQDVIPNVHYCFNYHTAPSDDTCLLVVRWQFEFALELLDSCQVYHEVVGNLSLPWCVPRSLSFAVVLCMLVKRWRNAEAEVEKNRFLGDEEK